ncbi:hypothetical protein [Aureispira anguillae]|uniref:Uncharacterized protein n=1 Tax=Aureispira anguillae TaxID=2864201 RepID=A0A915YBQ8_9BACT|nr:hypothetical protein [Aureispira anguillae]BDS10154.1 hypothetical protein AsAng_0008620 [Aureispira anguillae]
MPSKEVQFWDWFTQFEPQLYHADQNSVELFQALNQELAKISKGLTFEFSAVPEGEIKDFCISADGMKEYFPAVIDLVKVAPKFENWNIRAFRQRIANDNIAISMGDIDLSYDDIFFTYTIEDGKICIDLYIRDFVNNDDRFISAIFILLDALLGEYDVVTQIGAIEWTLLDEMQVEYLSPFISLRNLTDRNKAIKN